MSDPAVDGPHRQAGRLSDLLHRALATGDGVCWLVLDRAARGRPSGGLLGNLLDSQLRVEVPSSHPGLDPRLMPLLVRIDSAAASDSELLLASVYEALEAGRDDCFESGSGRQICGW